ncbi:MAG: single-stranded-DNA-specific exonuclease RecJ [Oscillospiraceae bacterium]|nr:single-stranded-DNA-specific exonuclease RecJ [Oscillospiraceae bacterium]
MKKWNIGSPDPSVVSGLQKKSDLSPLCCTVLVSQGYADLTSAADFMGCQELSHPSELCDMEDAAEIINQAVDEGKRICVYGDYDCDGVMSTVILYSFLSEIGADVTWRIPERSEGYGLNMQAVREMHEDGVNLIVTVDNGISAVEEAKLIQELGMELVITDHHQPGEVLPEALAVVDAHRLDNYSPYRFYCGAGIALLLVAAMNGGDTQMALEQFGDLAAVATVADVVPLTGENRLLVQRGIAYLENTERLGLRALREVSGLAGKPLNSVNIAFTIAPRINAAGRLESPRLAVELLLEENAERAVQLAQHLNTVNASRKECEQQILHEAEQQIAEHPEMIYDRVLIFAGNDWHAGVIGIVASRLEEQYGKPCFMISIQNGMGHGSARSFGVFHVFKALTSCKDLLEKFGGHPSAGGFTLKEENIPAFRKQLLRYAEEHHPEMPFMETNAVCALKPEFMNPEAVQSLETLAPFGAENPEPVFLAEHVIVQEILPTASGTHTRMTVQMFGQTYKAMYFGKSPEQTGIIAGNAYHMLTTLNANEYHGKVYVTMFVQEVRPAGIPQSKLLGAVQTYEKYRRKEELPQSYYKGMLPERKDLTAVYLAVGEQPVTPEILAASVMKQGINFCKLLIALDVFAELGLLSRNLQTGEVVRLPVQKKATLEDSEILTELRKLAGAE